MTQIKLYKGEAIAPAQPGLERLERGIHYPIADGADAFHIDHGRDYSRFFCGLGRAHFLLAHEGDDVVGTLAGVQRTFVRGDKPGCAIYLADLKVAATHRNGALAPRMLLHALGAWLTRSELRTPWIYAAGMVGARGDFTRSARALWHPARLMGLVASLRIYFVPARQLRDIDTRDAPACASRDCLDLSPLPLDEGPATVSTRGRKDLRLRSTGRPWPLLHVRQAPHSWGTGDLHALRRAAREADDPEQPICFALDERLCDHIAWLAQQGITTDTRCNVRAVLAPWMARGCSFVHLSTAEI